MRKANGDGIKLRIDSSTSRSKTSFRRWGKEKDKLAFKMLHSLWKESGINVDKFIKADESEIIDEYAEAFINNSSNKQFSEIIERIAAEYNWIRKPIFLFHRFKKIYSLENNLSVREVKLLRKILMKSDCDNIDYESVMFHFPGKQLSVIKRVAQSIL